MAACGVNNAWNNTGGQQQQQQQGAFISICTTTETTHTHTHYKQQSARYLISRLPGD